MKKLITITLSLVLVLMLSTGLTLAKGPAEKATGTVGLGEPVVGWYAEFNAHEAMGDRLEKGSMRTWNDTIQRELHYDVKYVMVDGDEAYFAALCTWDSSGVFEGKWLFVKVYDGATPGRKGDKIGWDWLSGTNEQQAMNRVSNMEDPNNWWKVIDGNLVVHTY